MAITSTVITVPIEDAWLCVCVHWGPDGRTDPTIRHAIYAYQSLLIPPGVGAYHWHDLADTACMEALTWVSMPGLVVDMCPACRNFAPGPHVPRYNIYRGGILPDPPICLLWDSWHGTPP